MTNRIAIDAQIFAIGAHKAINHRRKYTGACYTDHLREVAALVGLFGGTPMMIAAAWLHDVVEDTQVTKEDIAIHFSPELAELVGWLTDVSKPEDGNRFKRKQKDRVHLSQAPAEAQTIKYCDMISNTKDILNNDPKFARVYLAEKKALLDVMDRGDPELRQYCYDIVTSGMKVLNEMEQPNA